jgi:uncharacterized radical SAM superfamily protein
MSNDLLERCFNQSLPDLEPLFDEAYRISRRHFSNLIHFYVPGMVHFDTPFYKSTTSYNFPGISVTGRSCQLGCNHCRGKMLEGMIPATTPQKLYELCMEIKRGGSRGCLITGGSLSNGSVPLIEFVPMIKRIKQETGLRLVVHTGLVYPELVEALADAGIDAAMLDIIGSNDTMSEVCHLDGNIDLFDHSLSLLEQKNIPTVPHIVVGIHNGQIRGERQAVTMISKHHPAAIVVVALMPLSQTRMEHLRPPSPSDIARVLLALRLLMPSVPVLLGCARPRGMHKVETDILAVKAGVDGVAYPSEEVCSFAQELGLDLRFHEECCSLLWQVLGESERHS